jgi:hypothetical protein
MKFSPDNGWILLCLAGLAGCSSGSSSGPAAPPDVVLPAGAPQPEQSLDGLPAAQVLKIKYDKAELRCQIDGSDGFSWDVLHDYSDKRTGHLIAKDGPLTVSANFQIDRIEIHQTEDLRTDSGNYELLYTPVILGTYSFQTGPVRGDGALSGQGPLQLFESVPTQLNSEIHLNCLFDTELKPAYRSQFIKKR